jgi:UDP-N-acetylglucosamine--N-acetylmuramyl-(pentapeptide) pyrophosphoryl-undecaprenol N-acetylglucosamine transferase
VTVRERTQSRTFVMAGGGSGGHVIPLLAVAQELRSRGHECVFIGTRTGFEARLVPAANFPIEYIEIGGLKRVGIARVVRTLAQLPLGTYRVLRLLRRLKPAAIFSLGGYAAGPVVVAGWLARLPIVIMEPNAMPGFTNRWIGRVVSRALLNFSAAARFFPKGRSEVTGLPVRGEFFKIPAKAGGDKITVLITGGSQGSRTLNNASRESWNYFRESGFPVRFIHQTGRNMHQELAAEFARTGLEGEVAPFIDNMPAAFAQADLVVCRAGAGAMAELAAAGKPSILVPLPTAADDHQLHNARAFESAGAGRLVPDREMNGQRLYEEVKALAADPAALKGMSEKARAFAHPDAACRAADLLEQVSHE